MGRVREGDAGAPQPRKVTITEAAKKEIKKATDYYQERQAGLGSEFFACVQQALRRIAVLPLMAAEVEPGIRRAIVRKFQHSSYYAPEEAELSVLGVSHDKQDQEPLVRRFKRWQEKHRDNP